MSAANGGNGNGQAPTQAAKSDSGNGQAPTTPQANNSGSSSTAPNGQAPAANTDNDAAPLTAAEAKALRQELAEARRDAGKYRDENRKLSDAQLSAEQKRERDFTDMQTRVFELEARAQQQALQLGGYRLGAQLGIGDISAALALVQVEHGAEIKYSADGTPENLGDLLKAVIKDHPSLAGQAQPQRAAQAASSGGATNPGAIARPGATFTREQIARMSQREYEQNRTAIMDSLKAGTLRP